MISKVDIHLNDYLDFNPIVVRVELLAKFSKTCNFYFLEKVDSNTIEILFHITKVQIILTLEYDFTSILSRNEE